MSEAKRLAAVKAIDMHQALRRLPAIERSASSVRSS